LTDQHRLLARQIARASAGGDQVDLQRLLALINAAYLDMDRDRSRTDRANALMTEELVALEKQRKQLVGELQVQNTRFEAALENMSQGLCLLDADNRLIVSNRRFQQLYQLPDAALGAGCHISEILAASSLLDDAAAYLTLSAAHHYDFQRQELNNGRIIAIVHQPLPGGGCVDTFEDITEQHQAQLRVAHMSQHDPLTDLPNRLLLQERLQQVLLRCSRGERCAVLYLDLDRFKTVNDTLGHPIGDALLVAVSERLRSCLRKPDTVARIGGDEFVIVLGNAGELAQIAEVARRLIKDVSRPYQLHDQHIAIGVSIGIAVASAEGGDPNQLIKEADLALYSAKGAGRGCYRFFEASADQGAEAKRSLERDLCRAVNEQQFVLFYQPSINLQSRQLNGFEALLRWNSPERGLLMAESFQAVAEESGLIEAIGEWELRTACCDAMTWPGHLKLSVNLSAAQFKSRNLPAAINAALEESGLPAARLELELTESTLMEGNEATFATLQQLRKRGVSVALDDFGAGYCSLRFLLRCPIDRIKIDRAFINDIGQRPNSIAIVRAVIGLCSGLDIGSSAEGIETEEQLALLGVEQCQSGQGSLFGEAQPAQNLAPLMRAPPLSDTADIPIAARAAQ
jgi:diguanylate cyclase (GGDEF)-like protein